MPETVGPQDTSGTTTRSWEQPFRGDLAQQSFAWLLVQSHLAHATGTFRVARGRVRKIVCVVEGQPVFVESNLRNETLGAFLLVRGALEQSQLDQAMKEARQRSQKLGETLVQLGLVDQQIIDQTLLQQVQMKLAGLVRWPDGAFAWVPIDPLCQQVPRCPVNPVALALCAVAGFFRAEDLTKPLEQNLDLGLDLTDAGRRCQQTIVEVFGMEAAGSMLSGASLRQTVDQDQEDLLTRVAQVEALRACGLASHIEPTQSAMAANGSAAAEKPATSEKQLAADKPAVADKPVVGGTAPQPSGPVPAAVPKPPPQTPSAGKGTAATAKGTAAAAKGSAAPTAGAPAEPTDELTDSPAEDFATSHPTSQSLLSLNSLAPPSGDRPASKPGTVLLSPEDLAGPDSGEGTDVELETVVDTEPPAFQTDPLGELPFMAPRPADPDDDSPAVATDAQKEKQKKAVAQQLLSQLRQYHEENKRSDYYRVLEIHTQADPQAIEAAYRNLQERFSSERYAAVELSQDATKLAEVKDRINEAYTVLADPEQRRAYDERLAERRPRPKYDAFGAELYFQEGQAHLRKNDFSAAVEAFRQAVETNADQPDYHAFWGWALFLDCGRKEGGALAARPHLQQALRVAPDSAQAHELAGKIEKDAGDVDTAVSHLTQALALGPVRLDLFDTVKELLCSTGRFEELERQYRGIIFRLREKEPLKTAPLWVELAYLYHDQLGQPENAHVALQVAAKLAPDNAQVKTARKRFEQGQARSWQKIAQDHVEQFQADPQNPAPLHALLSLHLSGDRADAALAPATILVHQGNATPDEQKLFRRLSCGELVRATRTLDAATLDLIRHPQDTPAFQDLLALLSELLVEVFPVDLAQVGGVASKPTPLRALPHAFRDALEYVCRQLEMELPEVLVTQATEASAQPLPLHRAQLAVSQPLADHGDLTLVTFHLARACSCLVAGRQHLFSRPETELKDPLLATLSFFHPELKNEDPKGAIAAFRARLNKAQVDLKRLEQATDQLLAETTINLSEFKRAARRTAARVGLVVCADLSQALHALEEEKEIVSDVMAFALSQTYSDIRRQLGTSVAI